ncbi:hypothetical protein M426DRAFT_161624 [Hypoxylon sp. CI-4A]|nr:hypothetical protein M426DRAFT_161624 [Hypoxylon sp. CI-4A]
MTVADGESILRCRQCRKPFDKESTLRRHGYYCRSRTAARSSRPRSCISCARGKAGCDKKRPECSRCMTVGIVCQYPTNATTSSSTGETHTVDKPPGEVNGTTVSGDGLMLTDPEFTNFGDGFTEEGITNIGLVDFMNTQMNESYLSPPSLGHTTPSTDPTIQFQQRLSPFSFSIPSTPNVTVRSLVRRPKMQPRAQRTINLIFGTLKSYPLMMSRHHTLPPFIHPSFDAENAEMEALATCISLMRMIGAQGSRVLFWRNVQQECERISEECSRFSKWELLAAMQALSIYVIVRLDEGETEHNDCDFLLIKAVIIVVQQMSCVDVTCHAQCCFCDTGLETTWKEWMLRESRRRLGVVYRVINKLTYWDPASMCDMPEEFLLAPLPAKKQLWEAGDEFAWKAENQKDSGVQFGLAADGEIVRLEEGRLSCSDAWLSYESSGPVAQPRHAASWEDWCAGIDGFGGLVMLVASLAA